MARNMPDAVVAAGTAALRTEAPQRVREDVPLAVLIAALDFLTGLYINLHLHYISGDALSRVANAYDVLFGRDPHLAAIGFIWNPLPSLMELPLLLFAGRWPALAADGVASLFVSATFGGIAIYYILKIQRRLEVGRGGRVALALLFAANPMVLFYAANGMSDMMLVGAMLGAVSGALGYLREHSLHSLVAAGVWLAIAFGIRYEGAPLGVSLGLGLAFALWRQGAGPAELKGALLILLAPLLYVSGVWIYLNWLIMKQPLYFLTSVYGNLSQTSLGSYVLADAALQSARHHVVGTLLFVGHMAFLFWPVFIGMAVALVVALSRRGDPTAALLIGATLGMPLLQAALVYEGHSGGWARYFIYYIPNGFLLLAFAASLVRRRRLGTLALLLAVVLAIGGDLGNFHEETSSDVVGYGDIGIVRSLARSQPIEMYGDADAVVGYLSAHPHMSVLLDSYLAYPVVLRAYDPGRLIITSDVEFMSILSNPAGRVDALLVPEPTDVGALDAVNRQWPKLWQGKVSWAHLMKAFPGATGWRLYAVGRGAP